MTLRLSTRAAVIDAFVAAHSRRSGGAAHAAAIVFCRGGEGGVWLQLAERVTHRSLFDVHTITCHGRWEHFLREFRAL